MSINGTTSQAAGGRPSYRRRAVIVGLVVTISTLGLTTAAEAQFSVAKSISAAGQYASPPQVAVDPDGDALIVWTRGGGNDQSRVKARARSAAGVLGPIQAISPAGHGAGVPQVAVDPDGDAVIVWTRFGRDGRNPRVMARARSAAGVLGPVQTISAAGGQRQRVAVDRDGDALITWWQVPDYRIRARARSAAGVLGPIRTLSATGDFPGLHQVAIDRDGDAVIAWDGYDGTHTRVRARRFSAAGVLGPIRTLSPSGENASDVQVAVDRDRDALVVWRTSDYRILARRLSADGELGPIQPISGHGKLGFEAQVAVEPDGDAIVVWSDGRVKARRLSAAGVLGPIRVIATSGHQPQVAIDRDGDVVVVWQRWSGEDIGRRARALSASGVLGPAETLSTVGNEPFPPDLAMDRDGDVVVAWAQSGRTDQRIQISVGP